MPIVAIAATTASISASVGVINVTMRLDGIITTFNETVFFAELAKFVNIFVSRFVPYDVRSGSIIVDFGIQDSSTGVSAANVFSALSANLTALGNVIGYTVLSFTSTSPSAPPPQNLQTPSSVSSHHHLSGGAIAGIVVGVVAFVAIVVAVIIFFALRHRKYSRKESSNDSPVDLPAEERQSTI